MADATVNNEVTETPAAPAAKKSGKLKLIILLVVAMIGEAGAFMFVGGGSSTPATAATTEGAAATPADSAVDDLEKSKQAGLSEVEIHNFTVTNNIAAADTIVHVAFKLHALVPSDQETAFKEAVTMASKARVREAVEKIARSSTMDDLKDPNLATLKRLLKEEINKVLKQSYIVEVVISEFRTMEQ